MRRNPAFMQLWGDASTDLRYRWINKKVLLSFIWYTSLFDSHHAAPAHYHSGPLRGLVGKIQLLLPLERSGGTTKMERTRVNKSSVRLFPCLFPSAALHFQKNRARWLPPCVRSGAGCQNRSFLLSSLTRRKLESSDSVRPGNESAVVPGRKCFFLQIAGWSHTGIYATAADEQQLQPI